MADLMFIKQ
uniref:Serine threonine-protein kinase grp isoform x1 n=1 Tax=Triatoma infestans TaxID=30076 RepID=A0A170V3S7_TRIIF